MASCNMSEDQFKCSICLNVVTEPVTTPCGHNYCKACIIECWKNQGKYQCVTCKKVFIKRPELLLNTTLRDAVEEFKRHSTSGSEDQALANLDQIIAKHSGKDKPPVKPRPISAGHSRNDKLLAKPEPIIAEPCGKDKPPVKPRQISAEHSRNDKLPAKPEQCKNDKPLASKSQTQISPAKNPKVAMCKKHEKLLEMFCKEDQIAVCLECINKDHKTHTTVPLIEEYEQSTANLGRIRAEMNQMMDTKSRKIQTLVAVVQAIERSQVEIIEVIAEKQKQAVGFIKDLEEEITEHKRRSTELEKLSHTKDHLHLLQSFPSQSTQPYTKDWSLFSVHSDLSEETLRKALPVLENILIDKVKKLCDELKRILPDNPEKICPDGNGEQITTKSAAAPTPLPRTTGITDQDRQKTTQPNPVHSGNEAESVASERRSRREPPYMSEDDRSSSQRPTSSAQSLPIPSPRTTGITDQDTLKTTQPKPVHSGDTPSNAASAKTKVLKNSEPESQAEGNIQVSRTGDRHNSPSINDKSQQRSDGSWNLVLVGRTGTGKSASGNTILGKQHFKSQASSMPVTTECSWKEFTKHKNTVRVIDTPDFFDESIEGDQLKHIDHCKELCQATPSVYLLVIQVGRFTEGERDILNQLEKSFGTTIQDQTLVLFTHGEKLKEAGMSVEKFITEVDPNLKQIVAKCGGRYHVFKNNKSDNRQVKKLLEKIRKDDSSLFPELPKK